MWNHHHHHHHHHYPRISWRHKSQTKLQGRRNAIKKFVACATTCVLDYGNAVLEQTTTTTTDELRVLNTVARVIELTRTSSTTNCTGLDVPQRITFKLCMTVYKCLSAELCVPVADVAGRRQLRSASRRLLYFPLYNMTNYGRRTFRTPGVILHENAR